MSEKNNASAAGSIMLATVIVAVSVTASVIASYYMGRKMGAQKAPEKVAYVYINEDEVYKQGAGYASRSGDIEFAGRIAEASVAAVGEVAQRYQEKGYLVFSAKAMIRLDPMMDVTSEAVDLLNQSVGDRSEVKRSLLGGGSARR